MRTNKDFIFILPILTNSLAGQSFGHSFKLENHIDTDQVQLNCHQIGRLLDSYLQTFLNNLAMNSIYERIIKYSCRLLICWVTGGGKQVELI